ncbi:hypothetical protein BGZ76_003028, partial [Entomortierella beljakovae]
MPAQIKNDDQVAFTLVCGHLSSHIHLNPDPRQTANADLDAHLQNLDIHNHNDINSTENNCTPNQPVGNSSNDISDTDNDACESNEMEIDTTTTSNEIKDTHKNTTNLKNEIRSGIESIQKQTLHNQGSVLASDLSIIGFVKLDSIQSPPVLSRHWVSLDCFQEREKHIEEVKSEHQNDLKAAKTEESLAALLFPPNTPSTHTQYNQFSQRASVHPQAGFTSQQQSNGQQLNIPTMPPTSSKSSSFNRDGNGVNPPQEQQGYHSPTIHSLTKSLGGKKNEREAEPFTQEDAPKQQLYSTLHRALDQESMVAVVALQYPDKNCTRLRRWRRMQDEVPLKGTKSTSTTTTTSMLSKRISHPQISSPNLSDLSTMGGGSAVISQSSSLGSAIGSSAISPSLSTSASGGSNAPKDELNSALTMASLSTIVESDRLGKQSELFVLLILPRNTATTSAPWIPDLNHDKPQFSARAVSHGTQFMSEFGFNVINSLSSETSVVTHNIHDDKVMKGMEQFGSVRATLKDIQANLAVLCSSNTHGAKPNAWDKELGNKIRRRNLPAGDIRHRNLSAMAQNLLRGESGDIIIDFNIDDSDNQLESGAAVPTNKPNLPSLHSTKNANEVNIKVEQQMHDANIRLPKQEASQIHGSPMPGGVPTDPPGQGNSFADSSSIKITKGDEGEEADENLEGGSVRVWNTNSRARGPASAEQKGVLENDIPDSNVEVNLEHKRSSETVLVQRLLVEQQPGGQESETDEIEQDTVMEQSSVPQSLWASVSSGQKFPDQRSSAPESHQHSVGIIPNDPVARLKSSGLASQKRRREPRDDGSDDASSAERSSAQPSIVVRDEENVERAIIMPEPAATQIMTDQTNSTNHQGPKKGNKKSKRIKAEQLDDSLLQDTPREPKSLITTSSQDIQNSDLGQAPTITAGIEEQTKYGDIDPSQAEYPQKPSDLSSKMLPVQLDQQFLQPTNAQNRQVKSKGGKKRSKTPEQSLDPQYHSQSLQQSHAHHKVQENLSQSQQQQQQHSEYTQQQQLQEYQEQQQRSLPPPTFVNQHQRTPSGTPQWLADNSTPSVLSNIKVSGRGKKTSAVAQPQQPLPQVQHALPHQQDVQQKHHQDPQQPSAGNTNDDVASNGVSYGVGNSQPQPQMRHYSDEQIDRGLEIPHQRPPDSQDMMEMRRGGREGALSYSTQQAIASDPSARALAAPSQHQRNTSIQGVPHDQPYTSQSPSE